ncbi:MAG: RNA 3'-terminal phosphate cyclase [Polyangiales bacterium]
MTERITLDGSEGEGGGQILRSALALSLVTGRPFRVVNVRAGRAKPGLLRQHLTALRAAAEVGGATVEGAELGSRAVDFAPGAVRGGAYTFTVGSAGSAMLVLQAVLPALLTAAAPSELTLEGGTHNTMAPSFDFIERVFLPVVNRMGPTVTCALERAGFYPAGGGRATVRVTPSRSLARVELMERGAVLTRRVVARVAALSGSIAAREVKAALDVLGWDEGARVIEPLPREWGPGNVAFVEVACERATEIFMHHGERGRSAESVGAAAAEEARAWLGADVPVGEHLADQLLVPMALAGGGRFVTTAPSTHTTTNARVIERFLPVAITTTQRAEVTGAPSARWVVDVAPRGGAAPT